jgi:hypothetical protein
MGQKNLIFKNHLFLENSLYNPLTNHRKYDIIEVKPSFSENSSFLKTILFWMALQIFLIFKN